MNRERFLKHLAAEAAKDLAPYDVDDFVAEAREHLEESIQARLELGMGLRDAEREAVESFGSATTIARDIRRREPRIDRAFALVAVATVAFFVFATNTPVLPSLSYYGLIGVCVALNVALAVTSALARRLQWRVFALILLPLWVGTAARTATSKVSIFDVPDMEGPAVYNRSVVSDAIAWMRKDAQAQWELPNILLEDFARYERGESDLVPGRSLRLVDGRLRLKPEADRAKGEAAWRQAVIGGTRLSTATTGRLNRLADALEAQGDRPWWAEVPYQLGPAGERLGLSQVLVIYGGGHALFWGLGCLLRRRKRPTMRPIV